MDEGVCNCGLSFSGACMWWRTWVDQRLKATGLIFTCNFSCSLLLGHLDHTKVVISTFSAPFLFHCPQSSPTLTEATEVIPHVSFTAKPLSPLRNRSDICTNRLILAYTSRHCEPGFAHVACTLSVARCFLDINNIPINKQSSSSPHYKQKIGLKSLETRAVVSQSARATA